jgi:hypothetical protein
MSGQDGRRTERLELMLWKSKVQAHELFGTGGIATWCGIRVGRFAIGQNSTLLAVSIAIVVEF